MSKKITTVEVSAKCSDLCFISLIDDEGKVVAENDGYVPAFMPGDHYGDYVILSIDVETGKLLNWREPSDSAMLKDVKEM